MGGKEHQILLFSDVRTSNSRKYFHTFVHFLNRKSYKITWSLGPWLYLPCPFYCGHHERGYQINWKFSACSHLHDGGRGEDKYAQEPELRVLKRCQRCGSFQNFWRSTLYLSQLLWVGFWGPKIVASSCTYLGLAQVIIVLIIDI